MLVTIWPWTSVINILLLKPGTEDASVDVAIPETLIRHLRSSTYLILAVATYASSYERLLGAAAGASWVTLLALYVEIAARNMLVCHALYGGWHWFLYERRASVIALQGRKFNPANLREDGSLDEAKGYDPSFCRRYASFGVLIESAYELMAIFWWANGRFAIPRISDFWSCPAWNIGLILLCGPYWNDGHFYFAHRVMHPYFGKSSRFAPVDLGRYLYKRVHSLHHRSYNTGPWSGIAMHPVEHMVYFTRSVLPCLFLPLHPLHLLFNHYHVLISPLPGHDGCDAAIRNDRARAFPIRVRGYVCCAVGTCSL